MLQARPLALLCVALGGAILAASGARAREEGQSTDLEPPEICWRKQPRALAVRVRPAPGSHLNAEAPLLLTLHDGTYYSVRWTEPVGGDDPPEAEPKRRSPSAADEVVRLPRLAGEGSTGWTLEISGGVCDDDGSTCLAFHASDEVPLRGRRQAHMVVEPGPPPRTLPEPPAKTPRIPPDLDRPEQLHPGATWLKATGPGSVDAAFAAAQASGRNLLVDFHAAWCPPCDRLRDEFLTDVRRFSLLAGFVLLSVDADDPSSFELKDRYNVGGYPTVLVVDPEGRELDRILGYDGQADRFAARLESVREATGWSEPPEDASISERVRRLMAADRRTEAADLLLDMAPPAHEAFEGDYEALKLALTALADKPAASRLEIARALVDAAPTAGLTAAHAEEVARILEEEGRLDEAAAFRAELEERLSEFFSTRAPVEATIEQAGASLRVSAPFQALEPLDDRATAAWYRAGWVEPDVGRAIRLEGAGALAVAIVLDEVSRAPRTHRPPADLRVELTLPNDLIDWDRSALVRNEGRVHDLVDLLDAAGLPDVSEPLYRAMTERFPEAFTWHYALAGFLTRHRAGLGALEAAQAAWRCSYGDNRLRAAKRLAEHLQSEGLIDEALAIVDEALAEAAPVQENVRTHRYRAALEEQRAVLSAQEPR